MARQTEGLTDCKGVGYMNHPPEPAGSEPIHDGWNSGTSPRKPASSAQLLELERATAKATDLLARIDDLMHERGCPYALGCLEVITRGLITAAQAVTWQ